MEDLGTVFIVDDNPNNLQVLMGLLSQAGYKVRPALSGEIALRAVAASLPDVILLDVRMPPGIDGYETCRQLHANPHSRDVPVIFLSAMQDTEDKLAGFRAGGVDYVGKPFQAEEVLARVRTHVQLHRIQRQLERMVAERTQALTQSEARYRVLFEDSPMAVLVYDSDSLNTLAVNGAFTRLLGYTAAQTVGQSLDFGMAPNQPTQLRSLAAQLSRNSEQPAYTGAIQMRHRDGSLVDIEGVLQRVEYAGQRAQILMLQDVSASRQAEERLQSAAKEYQRQLEQTTYYDGLTGLPNRVRLLDLMRQGAEQARRTGCNMAVCYLDVDAFGPLNASYGQELGDRLLVHIAERLRGGLRGGDTLARTGGDEFALLLLSGDSDEQLDKLLARLLAGVAETFVADSLQLQVSASIGVTTFPQDDSDADSLLRHAEQAMLIAKQAGKGRMHRFDHETDKRVRAQAQTVEQMRQALARREFLLYYQPKVNLKLGTVVGAEALIRWRHPERGLLAPGAFLPAIENDEFMVDLGDWVIAEALTQMAAWREQGLDLAVSVNVAAQQMAQANFTDRLSELLAMHPGTPPGRLELEVLETSALDDIGKVERVIGACHAMGIGFSLDDFGTGYSSLTYLRRLSADTLKIDQSFVRSMLEDAGDLAIVSGVIGLAEAFSRKVIAEGVETVAHGRALAELGCVQIQGYGVARPMPAQDLPDWVKAWPAADWLAVINSLQSGASRPQDPRG